MKMITIPLESYIELLNDSRFLTCLQNGGVDNWEWYGEALNEYEELTEADIIPESK